MHKSTPNPEVQKEHNALYNIIRQQHQHQQQQQQYIGI